MSTENDMEVSADMYSASIPSTRRTIDSLQSSRFSLSAALKPQAQGLQDIIKTVQNLNLEFYPHGEIERGESIGEGETFWVEKCQFRKKTIAIKRLKISSDSRDEFIRRIQSVLLELQIMHHAPLRSHPNILTLLGYGWNNSGGSILPYILVDYCPGGNLRQYLITHKLTGQNRTFRGPHREATRRKELFMADVAAAVQALHTTGIVHGDLKLENVLVSDFDDRRRSPIARVCDFGHSIVKGPSEEGQASGIYRGTSRYNAPEVSHQSARSFDQMGLKKCDIWAFGILTWEILLDGASYLSQLPSDISEELDRKPSRDPQLLAAALPSTSVSLDPIQKGIFKDVLKRTIQFHPHERVDKLDKLLIMRKWRATGTTDLEAQLALHSGTSEWSYEIFRHDSDREIFWIHKSHIAEDFLTAYKDEGGDRSVQASAAWQLGCCYATGFGVSKDWAKAEEYFKHAAEMGSKVAQTFGPMLWDRGSSHQGSAYPATIRRRLSQDQIPRRLEFDEHRKAITIQTVSSQELSQDPGNINQKIMGEYVETIRQMRARSWLQLHTEEPPLNQALRARNWRAAQELMNWGIPPSQKDSSGRNMYHWLFMIDDSVATFASYLLASGDRVDLDALNQSASQSLSVDPQWPLRLHGTPLMHAISTGSRNTVAALLKLGADPFATSHTLDDIRSEVLWTAFHAAIEHHDVDTLKLLQNWPGAQTMICRWPEEVYPGLAQALCSATVFERIAMHGRNAKAKLDSVFQALWSSETSHGYQVLAQNFLPLAQKSMLSLLRLSLDNDDLEISEKLLGDRSDLAGDRYVPDTGSSQTRFTFPIHNAVRMASRRDDSRALRAVELILRYDPDGLSRLDSSGRSCLHIAAAGLSADLISFIVGRKGSLRDARDRQGATPLHYCESTQTLEQLVSLGARLNATDEEGRSAVFYAVARGLGDIVDGLCRMKANIDTFGRSPWNPLTMSIIQSRPDIMSILIGYGAKINIPNGHGDTPLHLAARKSSRYEIQLLLNQNADMSTRNKLGQYPLHVAAGWNNLAAVELLSETMPEHILADDFTSEDTSQRLPRSPIFVCAERSHTEAMHAMLLRLSKEDVERQDRYQRNFLHYAAGLKSVPLILHLASMGIDMSPHDEHGDTPLLLCLKSSFPGSTLEACEALVDSGASIDSPNIEGEFAWDIAFAEGRVDVLTYFLSHSASACQYITLAQHISNSKTVGKSEVTEAATPWWWNTIATRLDKKQRDTTEIKTNRERKCCKKHVLQLGIVTSNPKLLSALRIRMHAVETDLLDLGPSAGKEVMRKGYEHDQVLVSIQEVLEKLEQDPWARLGEPTTQWLTTGWVGRDPQFERYGAKTTADVNLARAKAPAPAPLSAVDRVMFDVVEDALNSS